MEKALEGVEVLECTQVLNGPYCGRLLAELGADVIKIEPPTGDLGRYFGAYIKSEGIFFIDNNVNKKLITLNLKHEKGRKILKELAKRSDVFIENYSPGTMDKLGAGYEALKEVNPEIIYVSSTGYGHTGPYKNILAFDSLIQAISGSMSLNGFPDRPPVRTKVPFMDYGAALFSTVAILAALYNKEKTGKGQRIDIAMYDVGIAFNTEMISFYLTEGKVVPRMGNRDYAGGPENAYKAKDGYVYILASFDHHWKRLLEVMGRNDLIDDPKYASRMSRTDEVDEIIQKWVETKSINEVFNLLAGIVPCAPVPTVDKVIGDPHLSARNMFVMAEHPTLGKIKIVGSPLKLSRTPGTVEWAGCPLGYHNEEVYGRLLGYSRDEIANLKKEGVI